MKNRLTDLNDHLFAQLERLADETLTPETIGLEVTRADAMVQMADRIVVGARLQLDACKLLAEHGDKIGRHLPMIGPARPEIVA
jgi:hypothetical protein